MLNTFICAPPLGLSCVPQLDFEIQELFEEPLLPLTLLLFGLDVLYVALLLRNNLRSNEVAIRDRAAFWMDARRRINQRKAPGHLKMLWLQIKAQHKLFRVSGEYKTRAFAMTIAVCLY